MTNWRVYYVREYYEDIYKRRQVSCIGEFTTESEAYLRMIELYARITNTETDSVYMSRIKE